MCSQYISVVSDSQYISVVSGSQYISAVGVVEIPA